LFVAFVLSSVETDLPACQLKSPAACPDCR